MGLRLAWCDGVSTSSGDEGFVVSGAGVRFTLKDIGPGTRDAFARLTALGEDEDRLAEVVEADRASDLPRWLYYLDRFTRRALVGRTAHDSGTRLATLVAVSPSFVWKPVSPAVDRRYVLSRFAYFRREQNAGVLESPLAHARVTLHDVRAVALVGALSAPATAAELAASGQLSADGVGSLLTLLLRAGMVCEAEAEESDPALRTWAFHDLVFHARSRKGRSDAPYGGTYRFAGESAPPPGEAVTLHRSDIEALERTDPPLAWVQERRRSVRAFDSTRPVSARQLGEFLYRVNRVKEYREAELETVRGPVAMDFAMRPYPAGGGLYELELYAAVNTCDGLAPGLYYHDPSVHRLVHVRERDQAIEGLLRDAAESTGVPAGELQVLLVLAARAPRVAWKYESIAYALILKHVGVMYQTMYLAATAMGLAACAAGGGDADLFAKATGLPYPAETSVGEFLLGSLRDTPGRV